MSDVKWIKIVVDIFDDEKILLIESLPERDSIIVIWFKLLCLAGKQNNGGVFMLNDRIAYTDEMLATIFRRPLNTVRLALQTFESFGMIEVVENVITIPTWEKHQSLEMLEKNREKNRKRVAAFRERQRLLASDKMRNDDVTYPVMITGEVTKSNVTRTEREGEGEREGEREREAPASRCEPSRPSIEDVENYCKENGYSVDAAAFVSYYTANGWMIGKVPMKDWKAAIRKWDITEKRNPGAKRNIKKAASSFGVDDLEAIANSF